MSTYREVKGIQLCQNERFASKYKLPELVHCEWKNYEIWILIVKYAKYEWLLMLFWILSTAHVQRGANRIDVAV